MRKANWFVASTALLASASAAYATQLKIATIEAFSGSGGEIGVVWAEGIRYGIDRINAAGGFNGEPVKLTEYDNQSTPGGASDKLRAAVADGARIVMSGGASIMAAQLSEDVRKYNQFERRQMASVRKELDQEYEAMVGLNVKPSKDESQVRKSSTSRT